MAAMKLMPLARPPLLRTPCHVHFVGALFVGGLNCMILLVMIGVWTMTLLINGLGLVLVGAITLGMWLAGRFRHGPVAPTARRGPPVWRGYDQPLLDDDPPTVPTAMQVRRGTWAYRLGHAIGHGAGRVLR